MFEFNVDSQSDKMAQCLKRMLSLPVFMCIGTEKVFSDSLGPRVGTLLNNRMKTPQFVYGLVNSNITAENLCASYQIIRALHPHKQIVVIDAAVGAHEQIGTVQVSPEGLLPGAATNKNLPQIGDVSIVGIVGERGMADFYTTASEKEKLVNKIAEFIVSAIVFATEDNLCSSLQQA